MFGFSKKPKSRRRTESRQSKTQADLEQQIRLKDEIIQSKDEQIAIFKETIDVLRDLLGAKQMTANVHSAEGKILLSDLQAKAALQNGLSPIRR